MPKKTRKLKSLSAGRPALASKASSVQSSRATRSVIRRHHTLQKQHLAAVAARDTARASNIAAQIEADGGIKAYQDASLTGQSASRGGDSSKVLIEWLASTCTGQQDLRLLEVGALTTTNACSRSNLIAEIVRTDLNPPDNGILKEDFMERPSPVSQSDQFDVLSLSLVLNYVPHPAGRGDMLLRTTNFLRERDQQLPLLFLVLPLPCVSNSRYLDRNRLKQIMESMGYVLVKEKETAKLSYTLWHWSKSRIARKDLAKREIRSGTKLNNFAIVVKKDTLHKVHNDEP